MFRTPDAYGFYYPTDELLTNPHIGFQTFQRFNGDTLNNPEDRRWTEGFPIEYQEDRGTRKNEQFPDTTVAYHRVYWRYFEPEEGRFNWELIDKALRTAKERGQTLMLRLAPYGSPGADGKMEERREIPDWLRAYVGPMLPIPPEKFSDSNFHKLCVLDTNNPAYARYYARAIRALGGRYNTDPRLDSVDMSIVGPWGEDAGSEFLERDKRNMILDAYLEGFSNTPLMALHHSVNAVYPYVKGRGQVGYRADCLGDMSRRSSWDGGEEYGGRDWTHMLDLYPFRIGLEGVRDMWRTGPVSFEACGVMYSWWDRYREHIDYIIEQSLDWHISTFNAKSSPVPPEWMPNVERWLKRMGYRFVLRTVAFPKAAAPGDDLSINLWIENKGVAPIYRRYPFCIRLKGPETRVLETPVDIRSWMPGDSIAELLLKLPGRLTAGDYLLQAGILDPQTGTPNIRFACDAKYDEGYYTFGKIAVSSDA